jgi:hypothetical protein
MNITLFLAYEKAKYTENQLFKPKKNTAKMMDLSKELPVL